MKRFRRKEAQSVPEVPLLADETDYMSAIPGHEETEPTVLKPASITQVLSQFEAENVGNRAKRQKVDELMTTVRDIGLQKPLLPAVTPQQVNKKDIGLKLLQRFGYSGKNANENDRSNEESKCKEPVNISSEMMYRHKEGLGLKQQQLQAQSAWLEKMKKKSQQFTDYQQLLALYRQKYKEYWSVLKVIYELDLRHSEDRDNPGHQTQVDHTVSEGDEEAIFSTPETKELHQRNQSRLLSDQFIAKESNPAEAERKEALADQSDESLLSIFPSPKSLSASLEDVKMKTQELGNRVYSLLLHLREHYGYCYYCCLQFPSYENLLSRCPDVTESEHDDDLNSDENNEGD